MNAGASFAERAFNLRPGLFPFESRFLDVSGARVHYVDEGRGPVLLMVHGNPTWSFVFRELIVRLRERFRCIAFDHPGFGLSTAPAGYRYLPDEHAAIAGAFVDALALQSFTPVVQDWGGPIGLTLAAARAERVERLVIGNTWCWPVNGDVHFELFSRTFGGPLGTYAIRHYNAFVNVLIPAGIKRHKVTPEVMEAYRRPLPTPARRMPSAIFPRSIIGARAFLREAEAGLARLAAKPALLLWGDADIAFRPKERSRFEGLLPRHRTVPLPGAGHYIWEDAPEEIAAAIDAWWAGV
jgi:haloalkane dehalogenase